MPNPARPQYQDIIESTWGQAVADTVIRRYATAAARDADLAAFTPAQLLGQVVTVGAALLVHNGTAWGPPGRIARVVADGTVGTITVAIPSWVASVEIEWQGGHNTGTAAPGYLVMRANGDVPGNTNYSYAIQQMGAVVATSASLTGGAWIAGVIRGDVLTSGRVQLPHLGTASSVKVCIAHSEDNNAGQGGSDANVRTFIMTGHRFGGAALTSLTLTPPTGNFKSGSVFDFFGRAS